MCDEQPDELVRRALKGFGDMPVTRLGDVLTRHGFVQPADWKTFTEPVDPIPAEPASAATPDAPNPEATEAAQ